MAVAVGVAAALRCGRPRSPPSPLLLQLWCREVERERDERFYCEEKERVSRVFAMNFGEEDE